MRIGALEAGGTKMVCTVATEQGEILERESFPTTTPDQSIPSPTRWFKERSVDALGIGAFGPTCVDPESPSCGTILETPQAPLARVRPSRGLRRRAWGARGLRHRRQRGVSR